MKKDLEKEKKDITNKSIKYAKKINKKIKCLLLIILIFILLIFAYFVRNAVIILSLNSKAKELSNVELKLSGHCTQGRESRRRHGYYRGYHGLFGGDILWIRRYSCTMGG